jgi:hypothetical protein
VREGILTTWTGLRSGTALDCDNGRELGRHRVATVCSVNHVAIATAKF